MAGVSSQQIMRFKAGCLINKLATNCKRPLASSGEPTKASRDRRLAKAATRLSGKCL